MKGSTLAIILAVVVVIIIIIAVILYSGLLSGEETEPSPDDAAADAAVDESEQPLYGQTVSEYVAPEATWDGEPTPKPFIVDGGRTYKFYPFYNTEVHSASRTSKEEWEDAMLLGKRCDATAGCVAFNSAGWLSKQVADPDHFVKWTDDPTRGTYILDGVVYSNPPVSTPTKGAELKTAKHTYDFYPYYTSRGSDIRRVNYSSKADIANACDAEPTCRAFNTHGVLKSGVAEQSKWKRWTTQPSRGLYVRK